MIIKVNDTIYDDAAWSFDPDRGTASLHLKTDESLSEIAVNFDGDDTIRAYDDNDNETGIWYVTRVLSIMEGWESHPDESREVIVTLKATSLSTEAEESINTSIDEANDALIELASLIEDMEDTNIEITRIKDRLDGIPNNIVEILDQINTTYNGLADRVARLENQIGG